MKKVLIMGCPGAGKARLAVRLGQITGLEVYHIKDDRFSERHSEEEKNAWRDAVSKIVAKDSWIIEGTQRITYDMRIENADTVLFLCIKPMVCLRNFIKRSLGSLKTNDRYGMRLTGDMLKKILAYKKVMHPLINDLLEKHKEHLDVRFFKDEEEAYAFIEEIRTEYSKKQ
ncbi:MAG: hypothetical protein JXB33_07510 [Clostridia bacterium]|nr:hypothetical protein [Clostridia bacterium]